MAGCEKKEWSKEYLLEWCNKDFKKINKEQKTFTDEQLTSICDCVANKMFAKYKSMGEAEQDKKGADEIGSECAREVMQGN